MQTESNQKLNVVIFTDTFLPKIDGVGISIDHFSRILAGRGHRFVICCPKYGEGDFKQIGDNIHVIRFKNAPLPSYPDIKAVIPSQKKIRQAFNMFPPDVVHVQTPGLLGQYGVLAARMYGVPLIGTYHTLISEQDTYISLYRLLKVDTLLNYFRADKKIKKRLDKVERKKTKGIKNRIIYNLCNKLYEQGELIISPSYRIKADLQESGVKTPIEVISNGMDLTRFKGEVRSPASPPRLLHVGRISYEKNCEVVLKAFALILEKIPDATLDIIGDGPALPSLKIEARQLGVDHRVTFPGFISRDDLPEIYPKYDLFLTASTMETQGLVVLEAVSCGLPCVGVDAYALPELIHDGENGYVVEPYDHIRMAERALEILGNTELYRRFSAHGLKIAGEHELIGCADKLENVYRTIANRKRASAALPSG